MTHDEAAYDEYLTRLYNGSAQEFGKVADWRGFQPPLEPERYRVGLELSDSAPGGLAIPTEVPVTSRADMPITPGRSAARLNSLSFALFRPTY